MTPQEKQHERRQAYARTFCGDTGKLHPEAVKVLADLRRFCRVNQSGLVVSPASKMVDSHATVYATGMRDVYLRIAGFIGLDESLAIEEPQRDRTNIDPEPDAHADPVSDA